MVSIGMVAKKQIAVKKTNSSGFSSGSVGKALEGPGCDVSLG